YNASRETYSISKSIFLAVGLVFFYACTDEIHQLFVKGRSGRFRDVMIDTSGGATAMLSVCLLSFTKAASLLKKNSN
ncbi:MAG: VanZ family protein, partial [Clostridiaceae bacterium]|nr:VanZ family protein [Clostridiaceae bacterium]